MDRPHRRTVYWPLAITAIVIVCVAWAALSAWNGVVAIGAEVVQILWILPALVGLHLTQLLLAGLAWRSLFGRSLFGRSLFAGRQSGLAVPGVAVFYSLRVIREGIDSLLPVAQVGGEIVGAGLLARPGMPLSLAAGSVIVDITIELLTQVLFLLAGLAALAWLSPLAAWGLWTEILLVGGGVTAGVVLAQRFGLLNALDALLRRMAARWPSLAGASLAGVQAAALGFYRQPAAIIGCILLHVPAWGLGTIESWAVLHLLGMPVTPLQALVVESLGMAARSAGFAIPGALGVQEGGFALAAMAAGLPAAPALSLSLVKRMREIAVGMIGLALWRWTARCSAT